MKSGVVEGPAIAGGHHLDASVLAVILPTRNHNCHNICHIHPCNAEGGDIDVIR